MERGKIIQYDGQTGKGIVSAGGNRHDFVLANWVGDDAPTLSRNVEFALVDGVVSQVAPVPEAVLAQEKAAELKAAMTSHGQQIGAKAKAIFGVPVLACLAVYIIVGFSQPFMSINASMVSMNLSLSDLTSNLDMQYGSAYHLLFLASVLAPLALFFTRQKYVWLTLALPSVAAVAPVLSAWLSFRSAQAQMQQSLQSMQGMLGSFGGMAQNMANQVGFGSTYHFGLGAYVIAATSLGFYPDFTDTPEKAYA